MPTVQMWLEPEPGGVCCVAGITWPNGHYSEFRESVSVPSVAGDDDFPAYDPKFDGANAGKVWGPFEAQKAIMAYGQYALARGYSKTHPPPNAMFLEWGKHHGFHKDRGALGNLVHDLGGAVKDVAKNPVVDALLPVLAINANPKLTPIRDAVVQKLPIPALPQAVNFGESLKEAGKLAAAQNLKSTGDALRNPRTQQALEHVGVPREASQRAASLFDATRSATAAIALQRKGQHAAAEPYKRAAKAHAAKARVPEHAVNQAAQKVYYLAIVPGGGA